MGRPGAIQTSKIDDTYDGFFNVTNESQDHASGGGVRLDMIDESTGEGTDTDDDYELSMDEFGRPLRYQWEHYDNSDDGDGDILHITHDYDRNSNRKYDHRKVYAAHSKAFKHDDLDRIIGRDEGVLDTDSGGEVELDANGLASVGDYWNRDGRDWTLDQVGNPTQVDTTFDTDR